MLIVAENASVRFGGEATIPLHYFRILRSRGIEAWMIVHHRNRAELLGLIPNDIQRVYFIPDTIIHRKLVWVLEHLPPRFACFTIGSAIHAFGQLYARHLARTLIESFDINVIHQPTPVSPKQVSLLHGLGVPLVIGPMNGNMTFPPAFRRRESLVDRVFISAGRSCAAIFNAVLPGKRYAQRLLVANPRTARALPRPFYGRIEHVVENGVDLSTWDRQGQPPDPPPGPVAMDRASRPADGPTRLVFLGRLVDWKAVDLLLHATALARAHVPVQLAIVGDGPCRIELETLSRQLSLSDIVRFHGWLPQSAAARELAASDVLVLPSLQECGGAVVLEAMAMGLPVIATNWGGPADYLDQTCGILVDPKGQDEFVLDLSKAIVTLARDPELRRKMGEAGHQKVIHEYDWERKVDRIVRVYSEVIGERVPLCI